MITSLTLQGFKRHRHETHLPLAPVTLLLGGNSTGKSSVFQALLALKQTIESSDTGIPSLVTDGHRTALGAFSHVVSSSLPPAERELRIAVECEDPGRRGSSPRTWAADLRYANPNDTTADGAGFVSDANELTHLQLRRDETTLTSTPWPVESDPDEQAFQRAVFIRIQTVTRGEELLWQRHSPNEPAAADPGIPEDEARDRPVDAAPVEHRIRMTSRSISLDPPADAAGDGAPRWIHVVHEPLNLLEARLRDLRHIGPTRQPGARAYTVTRTAQPEVGAQGEHLLNVLLTGVGDQTNEILHRIGVDYEVRLEQLKTLSQSWDIRLHDKLAGDSREVGIGDVGFGISQVLPIIVEWSSILRRRSPTRPQTFLVEQPELHLHPRLQARLMHELCGPACERHQRRSTVPDDSQAADPGSVQVIIETHSETIVLAVQQLVRSGRLAPEDISILTFETDREDGQPVITQVRLSSQGRFLDPWPGGFFPENTALRLKEL